MKKKYLYHVSETNTEFIEVQRKLPKDPSEKEPSVPRLCVCPSVPGCFAARLFKQKELYLYRTIKKTKGIKPYNVWDAVITGERWLIPPTRLSKIAIIEEGEVLWAQKLIRCYHNITYNASDARLRFAQFGIAWKIFGPKFPNKSEEKFCYDMIKYLKINDPEEYILQRIENATNNDLDIAVPKEMKDSPYKGAKNLGQGAYKDGLNQSSYVGIKKKYYKPILGS